MKDGQWTLEQKFPNTGNPSGWTLKTTPDKFGNVAAWWVNADGMVEWRNEIGSSAIPSALDLWNLFGSWLEWKRVDHRKRAEVEQLEERGTTQEPGDTAQAWRVEVCAPTEDNPTGQVYTDGDVLVWLDRWGIFKSNYPSERINDMARMQVVWFGLMVERGRQHQKTRKDEDHGKTKRETTD